MWVICKVAVSDFVTVAVKSQEVMTVNLVNLSKIDTENRLLYKRHTFIMSLSVWFLQVRITHKNQVPILLGPPQKTPFFFFKKRNRSRN